MRARPKTEAHDIMNAGMGSDLLAITASGEDEVGLVERFTRRITEAGCNIEESRMAVLGGQFAILMLLSGPWNALSRIEGQIDAIARELDLAIFCKRTRAREAGEPLIPYQVEAVALDHPGIVQSLASFFAAHRINIEEMATDSYPAPHTGTAMFSVRITVGVPASTHIASLRGDFLDYCDDLNLDATIEPARG
ncbi:MAG: hypothetical protein OHK0026_03740 [Rhodocyclaceae bacterium]